MSPLYVFVKLLSIFELPAALTVRTVERGLRHVIYEGVNQHSKPLDLFKLLLTCDILKIVILG